MSHKFDDDGVCEMCGFDGAEWHWWRFSTYEGKAMQTPMPPCGKDEIDTSTKKNYEST